MTGENISGALTENVTSYLNIDVVGNRISQFFSFFTDNFFAKLVDAWWIIALYIAIVIISSIVAYKVYKNYKHVLRKFVYRVDEVWYKFVKAVDESKDTMYQYDEAVRMLFAGKKKIIESENKNYVDHYETIQKDVEYLERMLNKKIIADEEWARIEKMRAFVIKTRRMYDALSVFLGVITIGIYRLAHKKLHY